MSRVGWVSRTTLPTDSYVATTIDCHFSRIMGKPRSDQKSRLTAINASIGVGPELDEASRNQWSGCLQHFTTSCLANQTSHLGPRRLCLTTVQFTKREQSFKVTL